MTKEQIGNKPASQKTLREDYIGQALAGTTENCPESHNYANIAADRAIKCADAVIERLAAESKEGK